MFNYSNVTHYKVHIQLKKTKSQNFTKIDLVVPLKYFSRLNHKNDYKKIYILLNITNIIFQINNTYILNITHQRNEAPSGGVVEELQVVLPEVEHAHHESEQDEQTDQPGVVGGSEHADLGRVLLCILILKMLSFLSHLDH